MKLIVKYRTIVLNCYVHFMDSHVGVTTFELLTKLADVITSSHCQLFEEKIFLHVFTRKTSSNNQGAVSFLFWIVSDIYLIFANI